ncbi:family 20 glycosylhydrolase [Pedobacter glucosidilyticus]|uniref:family 20 glycosylhydrolase n=1 Tax=Pedobacter glucosidilyticus TaxID=1122941 RepID=UPI00047B8509|nr:family 20 glycosylhydrolase [Pedobacter glucosidilyticus]
MMNKIFLSCLILLSGFGLKAQPIDINKLEVEWTLLSNNYEGKNQFTASFIIHNKSQQILPASGWKLYFSHPRKATQVITKNAVITTINGEFCSLTPHANFKAVLPATKSVITYVAEGKALTYSDGPGGLYLVFDKDPKKTYNIVNFKINAVPNQEKAKLKLSPASIYQKNEAIKNETLSASRIILPSPINTVKLQGQFVLSAKTVLVFDEFFSHEAKLLQDDIAQFLGKKLTTNKDLSTPVIIFKKVNGLAKEAYQLKVKPDSIIITATQTAGAFYAIQSLKMLMPLSVWKAKQTQIAIPAVEITDEPRFGYRSFMLDVARNFQTKAQVLKVLDLMALYKLNNLHFHLNDDEGWRLEIPALPELTQIGAKRGHTLDDKQNLQPAYGSGPDTSALPGSGFYSKTDFLEILRYAKARHINIIPEIETPGHARAAIKAMDARYERFMKTGNPLEAKRYLLRDTADISIYKSVQGYHDNVMNIALPSTYTFIEKVVDEIIAMYQQADAPLKTIHLGGDEVPAGVWQKSPAIQNLMQKENIKEYDDLWYYYLAKANTILKQKGLYLSGWEEVAMRKTKLDGKNHYIANPDFTTQNFHTYVWNNVWGWGQEDLAYRLANAGYKVILAPVTNFYFDLAYEKDADEPGLYWGSYVDVDKPFYFNPFDYYKSAKEDLQGNPLDKSILKNKERLTAYGQSNIVGLQAQIWSEKISGPKQLEYMLLPKLLGFAERAWAAEPVWSSTADSVLAQEAYTQDWNWFVNLLGKRELPRLDYLNGGYQYRIPAVGIHKESGWIKANFQFPGFTLRYTTDGSLPDANSTVYTKPFLYKGTVNFRAFDSKGRGGRVSSILKD